MTLTAAEAADLFRRAPDRMIDVGAGKVAIRTVGTGPDVLFVHGWPVSGATYRTLLPHLAEHVTCHVIDLVGAGSSEYDERTPVSIDGHIEAVRRVVDELGSTDVAVVGHDSGGMIARHALAGDTRVRSMVMIDTEQPAGFTWRFKTFLYGRHLPGYGKVLGWLVGQRTPQAWAEALRSTLRDPVELARRGRAAAERARGFSWVAAARAHVEQVYAPLLTRSSTGTDAP